MSRNIVLNDSRGKNYCILKQRIRTILQKSQNKRGKKLSGKSEKIELVLKCWNEHGTKNNDSLGGWQEAKLRNYTFWHKQRAGCKRVRKEVSALQVGWEGGERLRPPDSRIAHKHIRGCDLGCKLHDFVLIPTVYFMRSGTTSDDNTFKANMVDFGTGCQPYKRKNYEQCVCARREMR